MILWMLWALAGSQDGTSPSPDPPLAFSLASHPSVLVGKGEFSLQSDARVQIVGPTAVSPSFFRVPPDPSLLGFAPDSWMLGEPYRNDRSEKTYLAVPLTESASARTGTIELKGSWKIALLPTDPFDPHPRSISLRSRGEGSVRQELPRANNGNPWGGGNGSPWSPAIFTETPLGTVYWPFSVETPAETTAPHSRVRIK